MDEKAGGESSPPHGDQVSRRYFGVGQEGRKELEVTLLTDYISTFTHRARTSSDDTGTGMIESNDDLCACSHELPHFPQAKL